MFSHGKTETLDMTKGAILPQIVSFAIPLFLGNIFQQLYNTTDCFIVGRFLGRDALAAVGSTSHLVSIAIGFFNGLSIGAQVVISQAFGAKDIKALKAAIHTALLFSLIIGLVLSFAGVFTSPLILKLISVPGSVFSLASVYLKIYFSGLLFLILYNMASGILRGLGDSKRPLYFLIFSSLINIFLDLFFVVILHKGIEGVALATVLAQMISIIPVLCVLCSSKNEVFKINLKELKINFPILIRILKIGLPGAISSSITAFSNTFMQKYVNAFGEACIAGWSVFARFDNFIIMPMQSIAFSVTTFVSQNYGAKQPERIKKGVRLSYLMNISLITFLALLLFILAPFLSSIFTNDKTSIHYASLFIRYTAPFYILCTTTMFFSHTMRGFGLSLIPTFITFSCFVALRQIFLFIMTQIFPGERGFVFVAFTYPLAWCVSSIIMILYYRKKTAKLFKS